MNYLKEYLMVIFTAIKLRIKEIKITQEIIFSILLTSTVIILVISSIMHWDKYCSIEECLEDYCNDLNEWCGCFKGKLICDVNMIHKCDYLCDLNETI